MKILLVSSTTETIQETLDKLDKSWEKISFSEYGKENARVFPLVSGYGPTFLTYALSRFKGIENIDYVIYAGIAAATTRILELGQTVNVGRDIFADMGIEESDGTFNDMFDLKFHPLIKYPFFKGEIFNEDIINPTKLRVVKSISVNKIPGTYEGIEELEKKYHADIISTNGAAFAYACRMLDVKYFQIRSVYRYLEPTTIRDREKEYALKNLNSQIWKLIDHLSYEKKEFLEPG
jgi:hypothetical protein